MKSHQHSIKNHQKLTNKVSRAPHSILLEWLTCLWDTLYKAKGKSETGFALRPATDIRTHMCGFRARG